LAARALHDALEDAGVGQGHPLLVLCVPGRERDHPALQGGSLTELLASISRRAGVTLHPASLVLEGGAATAVGCLQRVPDWLSVADTVVIGGVDTLIGAEDMRRLAAQGRLAGAGVPAGVLPGEGSAFLAFRSGERHLVPLATVVGVGAGEEAVPVLMEGWSTGTGMVAALGRALGSREEGYVAFVSSTFNGERYAALESALVRPRFYQTRRPRLPLLLPAKTTGDLGAAAGILAVIAAAMAIGRGYAEGHLAMCEAASDDGLRAACLVTSSERAWRSATARALVATSR
jgi:3-oxoacyl-[acyl-carrier-protein] synthase-1